MVYLCRNSSGNCWFMFCFMDVVRFFMNYAIFRELWQWLDAIWGRLFEIAPSRNTRRPGKLLSQIKFVLTPTQLHTLACQSVATFSLYTWPSWTHDNIADEENNIYFISSKYGESQAPCLVLLYHVLEYMQLQLTLITLIFTHKVFLFLAPKRDEESEESGNLMR